MKTDIKKHASLLIGIFVLYLAIRYWDGAVNIFSMAVSAATPLIAGLAIAYILNILMSFYERHYFPKSKAVIVAKTRRIACMLLAFLSLIGIVALIIGIVVPELVNCTKHLFAEVPAAVMNLLAYLEKNEMIEQYVIMLEEYLVENFSGMEDKLMSGAQSVLSGVGGVMSSVVSVVGSAFSSVVTFLVAIIFSIYILLGKEKLGAQARRIISTYCKKRADKIFYIVDTLDDSFHHFIVGQCTEAVILGLLCMLGMWIFRFPYAVMIGVLIGFTALIPIAGAYIGAGVGAFMMLTESPLTALLFIIFIVVLQQLEGNLVYPRVVGSSIGLPGIWVLAAITVGGGLMGVFGMLLAVPVVAAVYKLIQADVRKRNDVESIVSTDKDDEELEEKEQMEAKE